MSFFEWNENKRIINLKKHGIDFIDAIHVFDDSHRIEFETYRNGEHRFITIGCVNEVILLLVYVHRKENRRLISARCASVEERNYYE